MWYRFDESQFKLRGMEMKIISAANGRVCVGGEIVRGRPVL